MEYMTRAAAVFHVDGIHLPAKVNGAPAEADSAKLLGGTNGQPHTRKQGVGSAIVHMKDVLLGNDRPPAQRHQYRLIASTVMWSLLVGAVLGMGIESFLEAEGGYGLRQWLLRNTGSDETGHVCRDGLLLAGPTKNHLQMLLFTAMLLWSFVGVAIVADIFMVSTLSRGGTLSLGRGGTLSLGLSLTPTFVPTFFPSSPQPQPRAASISNASRYLPSPGGH